MTKEKKRCSTLLITEMQIKAIMRYHLTLVRIAVIKKSTGTSLVAQWIRFHAPNAGGPGSIPGQGTRSHMHVTTKNSHATTKEPACHN